MPIPVHIILAFAACFLGTGLVIILADGPDYLVTHPLATVIFLMADAIAICVLALMLSGLLHLAIGGRFARMWWRSLVPVAILILGALYLLEITG